MSTWIDPTNVDLSHIFIAGMIVGILLGYVIGAIRNAPAQDAQDTFVKKQEG